MTDGRYTDRSTVGDHVPAADGCIDRRTEDRTGGETRR
jgi:hypothetical protein